MYKYCYLNDRFTTDSQAKISISDIGLIRGFGVFDLIRCYNGIPFRLNDYLKRLKASARSMGLKLPKTNKELTEIIYELLAKNKIKDQECCVRIVLTGGQIKNGMEFDPNTPTLAVMIEAVPKLKPSLFTQGGKLMTLEYRRILPEIKSTNYLIAVTNQKKKKKNRAVEILFVDQGLVLEASTSNLFVLKGKTLITPDRGVLAGIYRQTVIERARKKGLQIEERPLSVKEMLSADEVFLTATNKDIVPITAVDNQLISLGTVGPYTRDLMIDLAEYIEWHCRRQRSQMTR